MALCLFFSSAGSGGFTTPSSHKAHYPLWAILSILPPPTQALSFIGYRNIPTKLNLIISPFSPQN